MYRKGRPHEAIAKNQEKGQAGPGLRDPLLGICRQPMASGTVCLPDHKGQNPLQGIIYVDFADGSFLQQRDRFFRIESIVH